MTAHKPPFRELQAIELAASFKASAETPYVSVFIVYGKGPHAFGSTEFKTMQELSEGIAKEAKLYELPRTQYTARYGHNATVIAFSNKKIHGDFMRAMLGRNVEPYDRIVQVADKSREWHQAAGQYITYVNRAHREQKVEGGLLSHQNVPLFGGTLVDYTFPDLATMKAFCECINQGQFDAAAADMKKAPPSRPQVS